ncbi:Uncharacterized protein DAT39_020331, partial [Clarias magur]
HAMKSARPHERGTGLVCPISYRRILSESWRIIRHWPRPCPAHTAKRPSGAA